MNTYFVSACSNKLLGMGRIWRGGGWGGGYNIIEGDQDFVVLAAMRNGEKHCIEDSNSMW